jgi:general secretion pathway protein E
MTGLFPFSWAQKAGVIYLPGDRKGLYCRETVEASALHEAYRSRPGLRLHTLGEADFNQLLLDTYQDGGSQAQQAIDDLNSKGDFLRLAESLKDDVDLLDRGDDAPIVRFINAMLAEAITEKASDIHIEPGEQQLGIRFRIDGILHPVLSPPGHLVAVVTSRIKVMAKLDIAEKRIPQDGRIALRIAGRAVDVRVSTIPVRYGERVVLRLLDKDSMQFSLQRLGMFEAQQQILRQLLDMPHGILLVCGPTGSGKSTTLYAALNTIHAAERNIMTVEDPIEYDLDGVGQVPVNVKTGMTFAKGLRAILRQDPDVIMIGEIRDAETAQIAIQASLTGHLVLSTLHTNSASGAVGRLRDMGVEPWLISSSLIGILSQRLVRTLCKACRIREPVSSSSAALMGITEGRMIWRPNGCNLCNGNGYKGRMGIHELVAIDGELRQRIAEGAHETDLEILIRRETMSLRQVGYNHVLAGKTSIEEILTVTRKD